MINLSALFQKISIFCLAGLFQGLLFACSQDLDPSDRQPRNNRTQPDEEAQEKARPADQVLSGSMTSGGGGTILADPVPQEKISEVIKEIRRDLFLHLNALSFAKAIESGEVSEDQAKEADLIPWSPWMERFVGEPTQTLSLLDQIIFMDFDDKPCSFAGQETDGSFQENEICLSSFSMSQPGKLNEIDYYPQVMALAMHELAHGLGADEAASLEVQRAVLHIFRNTSYEVLKQQLKRSERAMELADHTLKLGFYNFSDRDLNRVVSGFNDNWQDIFLKLPGQPLFNFPYSLIKESSTISLQLFALEMGIASFEKSIGNPYYTEGYEYHQRIFSDEVQAHCAHPEIIDLLYDGSPTFPAQMPGPDCQIYVLHRGGGEMDYEQLKKMSETIHAAYLQIEAEATQAGILTK